MQHFLSEQGSLKNKKKILMDLSVQLPHTSKDFLSSSAGTGGSVAWLPTSISGLLALDINSILFCTEKKFFQQCKTLLNFFVQINFPKSCHIYQYNYSKSKFISL